jgi:hypothetical protein
MLARTSHSNDADLNRVVAPYIARIAKAGQHPNPHDGLPIPNGTTRSLKPSICSGMASQRPPNAGTIAGQTINTRC